jgi:integrase
MRRSELLALKWSDIDLILREHKENQKNMKSLLGFNFTEDDLIIDAICAHYGLGRLTMALPKLYRPERPRGEKKAAGRLSARS